MAKRKRTRRGGHYFISKPQSLEPARKTVYLNSSDSEIEDVRGQIYGAYLDAQQPVTPILAKNMDLSQMKHIDGKPALRMRGQFWRLIKINDNGDRGMSVVVESKPCEVST